MKSGYIVMSFSMTNSKQPGGKQDIGSKESKDSEYSISSPILNGIMTS